MSLLTQKVLFVSIAAEIALMFVGILIVPSSLLTLSGIGEPIAVVGLLVIVAILGWIGPLSIPRLAPAAGTCLVVAVGFALAYDTLLLADLLGHQLAVDPYWIFVVGAVVAGGWTSLHLGSFFKGVLVSTWALVLGTTLWSIGWMLMLYATWGTVSQHAFWQRDGAITDFHRAGGGNLSVFLIQDLQGALFFHPLLSMVIGVACGSVGAAVGLGVDGLRKRVQPAPG